MPKSYWTIEKAKGEHSKPTSLNGKAVTGSNLADEYDEFVSVCLRQRACRPYHGAAELWIDIPTASKTSSDYETPAPIVEVVAAAALCSRTANPTMSDRGQPARCRRSAHWGFIAKTRTKTIEVDGEITSAAL